MSSHTPFSRCCIGLLQVEGCQRLLRDEKPYYQRFLVCEEHMRCLSLDINGQLSRFCQQCGKFEPVEAFDNNKRCACCVSRWGGAPPGFCQCRR